MNVGDMIGHYKILKVLGSGAMGKVMICEDEFLERKVAIKSLRPELVEDKDFIERFRAEATSLARLNHPNITTLFSPVLENNNFHMVMELISGRSLDDVLRERQAPLPVKHSLAIIAQAADGLSYAHQKGVIHRDIKPSNLMITDDGRVKIMDFGVSRVRGSVRLTRAGTAVGTPLYMSPEQCKGGEGDERSDIYSLAIVLYELLTGKPPFSGDSEYALIQAHINNEPAPLVPATKGVSARLENSIMKALSKKKEDRFQNMKEFSDELGATKILLDSPAVIINSENLISLISDIKEEGKPIDYARSRSSFFARRFKSINPAAKGLLIGSSCAFLLLLGFLYFDKSSRKFSQNTISNISTDLNKTLNNKDMKISSETKTNCNPQFATAEDPLGCRGNSGQQNLLSSNSDNKDTTEFKRKLIEAADKEDFSNYFRQALPLANQGDAAAQYYVGRAYITGASGHQDLKKAQDYLQKSAEQGYANAQHSLGVMYVNQMTAENINDIERNRKAFELFQKAALQGHAKSQYELGVYLERGDGAITKDIRSAKKYYEKAASQGHDDAKDALHRLSK